MGLCRLSFSAFCSGFVLVLKMRKSSVWSVYSGCSYVSIERRFLFLKQGNLEKNEKSAAHGRAEAFYRGGLYRHSYYRLNCLWLS